MWVAPSPLFSRRRGPHIKNFEVGSEMGMSGAFLYVYVLVSLLTDCRLEDSPQTQRNWRTLPSSQSPSLPTVPIFPHPPRTFCNAPGWATRAGVSEAAHGGGRGGSSKRHLGPDPHLGAFDQFAADALPAPRPLSLLETPLLGFSIKELDPLASPPPGASDSPFNYVR